MIDAHLRFVSSESRIALHDHVITSLLDGSSAEEVRDWALGVARRIDTTPAGVVFCIGEQRLGIESSRMLARAIAFAVCGALKELGAPFDLSVECDRPQTTRVVPGHQVRTLLPHHDGGHCSYLTPSVHDDPTWQPGLRTFSQSGFTTTTQHKLYQGIFIADPGEGLSVTTYYDLLALVRAAYERTHGRPATSIPVLATWIGNNIRASMELQLLHDSRYLTLGALLGSSSLAHHGVAWHYAEDEFTPAQLARFPELDEFQTISQTARHRSPTLRLLDDVLTQRLGLTWDEVRAQYEICVPSERFDLVIAHNLTLLHGGLMGGPGRLLEPICLTVSDVSTCQYEAWLAAAWRRAGDWNAW
jgi:hypothetical protein